MSGGSFGYLHCATGLEDLVTRLDGLSLMADALACLGYAPDAAQETAALLADVRAAQARAGAAADRLSGVWKAVEWWHSRDWAEEAVMDALAAYRGEAPATRNVYRLTPKEAAVVEMMRRNKEEEDEAWKRQ